MATKTISVRLEAYEKLRRARRHPSESFSEVIMRAVWEDAPMTGRDLLALYASEGPLLPPAALDRIERAKAEDRPPEDKWQTG
ncbi:MAG TPA: antitoxin VapB family protein [Longimicrobiales bacterium]|nr:antitoxin VapB family protein [Longimicrobiales bacterium]